MITDVAYRRREACRAILDGVIGLSPRDIAGLLSVLLDVDGLESVADHMQRSKAYKLEPAE